MKKGTTLEKHLHKLAEGDETIKGLESVYDLQKKKLNKYMTSVVTTFPTYSTHDTYHSRSIISAIESILGQKYIKKLSSVDTFLILMCAYMHDVGMIYTEKEVRDIWNTPEFMSFVEKCKSRDGELKSAAKMVSEGIETIDKNEFWPLDLRKNITILLMEYYRPEHSNRIETMTTGNNGIQDLIRIDESFLPERLNRMVNIISQTHTMTFERMLKKLPQEDSYNGEIFHPRMVGLMLRLGDLCDLDNNRFNKVGIATFGKLGDENLAHYFKHKSVETLYIASDKIHVIVNIDKDRITKECKDNWIPADGVQGEWRIDQVFQNTVKEHINWKSWMAKEIQNAKMFRNKIFPVNWKYIVPELEYDIKINGEPAVTNDKNLKFTFSQERAFKLIESISIYSGEKFIFLRELIQNAIDATKLQIWRDIKYEYKKETANLSPFKVAYSEKDFYDKYKIDISVSYDVSSDMARFAIHDAGIGISIRELRNNILTTGRSWKEREEYNDEIASMPEWLRPTGAFGIGLHTIFSVTDQFKIYTKSDSEIHGNRITLSSGKKGGYVFCEEVRPECERGTTFEFYIDVSQKEIREYFREDNVHPYLWDAENEVEQKIMTLISDYCPTPLLPIYVNEKLVAKNLVNSDWFDDLCMKDKINHTLEDIVDDNRYEFAFNYNYESLELWDGKYGVVYNIALRKDLYAYTNSCNPQAGFKGMRIEPICLDDIPTLFSIEYIDIEQGETDEFIDASRQKLIDSAQKRLNEMAKEALDYAEKVYINLMYSLSEDVDRNIFNKLVTDAAEEYLSGRKLTEKDIWQRAKAIRLRFMPVSWNGSKDFEGRVATHMIELKILDKVFGLEMRRLKTQYDSRINYRIFDLLDSVIKRWKCDWKTNVTKFYKYYFNEQMYGIIEHYMVIAAVALYECKENYYSKSKCYLFEKYIRKHMPYTCNWKKARDKISMSSNLLCELQGISGHSSGISGMNTVMHLIKPVTALVFDDWNYYGSYSQLDGISLEISGKYMPLLLYFQGAGKEWTQKHEIVWDKYMGNSIYGLFSYGMYNNESIYQVKNTQAIKLVCNVDKDIEIFLPMTIGMNVMSILIDGGIKAVVFEQSSSTQMGAVADERMINQCFKQYIEAVLEGNNETSISTFYGFTRYPHLVFQADGYYWNSYSRVYCRNWYIPTWDYDYKVKEFLNDCLESGLNIDQSVERLKESVQFDRVTSYIFKRKHEKDEAVTLEVVKKEYAQLAEELLEAWGVLGRG